LRVPNIFVFIDYTFKKYFYGAGMSNPSSNYFVATATIAAKLDYATKVAQRLSLTASNARALTLRAVQSAAGFRPLTDAIHRLSDITVSSSKKINAIAALLSKMSVEKHRADSAIRYFESAHRALKGTPNVASLDEVYQQTIDTQAGLAVSYRKNLQQLAQELDAVEGELRSAIVLKTLCQVEASQAGPMYKDALDNVAENVESIASIIKEQIVFSRQQVAALQ